MFSHLSHQEVVLRMLPVLDVGNAAPHTALLRAPEEAQVDQPAVLLALAILYYLRLCSPVSPLTRHSPDFRMRARSSAVLAAATTCFEPDEDAVGIKREPVVGRMALELIALPPSRRTSPVVVSTSRRQKPLHAEAGDARSRAIIDRMSANICRDTATSAIWNVLPTGDGLAAAIKLFVSSATLPIFVT
jgi:hypothetical protein